jgi:hypothetical protein
MLGSTLALQEATNLTHFSPPTTAIELRSVVGHIIRSGSIRARQIVPAKAIRFGDVELSAFETEKSSRA